jgi:integrase
MSTILRVLTRDWPRPAALTGCPWHTPTYADLVRLWAVVQTRSLSVGSRRLYRCAVRGVLRQSYHLGAITADQLLRLYDAVPQPHGTPAPGVHALDLADVHELLDALETDHTIRGARDRAVVGVLYGTGVRVGELCGLREPEDVRDDGHTLRVRGKGDRPRDAFLEDAQAIDYLAAWRRARGPDAGWLFCALRTLAFVDPTVPLQPRQVARMLAAAARAAHVGHVTPHDLRRTYATLMADRVPLDVVQRLLGHASIETTRLYIRRDDAQLRAAARRLPALAGSDGEKAADA